ncbi:MAG: ABC transporter ATP-binding protein [Deltaproteobacteria bacterium]|nr:MAG: ABC transporter ATP-binding protein [Deltaproteobacteria bacterium]
MANDVAIHVHHLAKSFRIGFLMRKVIAVRDSTFDVRQGEIFGLVGPNGAGKTTTIKMLLGLIAPDAGSGALFGVDIRDRRSRKRVGFLPENPHFYDYLRPEELLRYFGHLYGLPRSSVEARIPGLLERVGLAEAREKQLRKFSKGMLQRIGIAQALLPDSDLVILDEPQSGLDPMGRRDVREIIVELRERGKTVLFSSHILPDVEQICDRIGIIVRGRVTRVGPLHELVDPGDGAADVVIRLPAGESTLPDAALAVPHHRLPAGEWRLEVAGGTPVEPLLRQLLDAGVDIRHIDRHRRDLESIFLEEAARADAEAARAAEEDRA